MFFDDLILIVLFLFLFFLFVSVSLFCVFWFVPFVVSLLLDFFHFLIFWFLNVLIFVFSRFEKNVSFSIFSFHFFLILFILWSLTVAASRTLQQPQRTLTTWLLPVPFSLSPRQPGPLANRAVFFTKPPCHCCLHRFDEVSFTLCPRHFTFLSQACSVLSTVFFIVHSKLSLSGPSIETEIPQKLILHERYLSQTDGHAPFWQIRSFFFRH